LAHHITVGIRAVRSLQENQFRPRPAVCAARGIVEDRGEQLAYPPILTKRSRHLEPRKFRYPSGRSSSDTRESPPRAFSVNWFWARNAGDWH